MDEQEGTFSYNLRRTATIVGSLLVVISIYLSFDGFDGKVGKGVGYSLIGLAIGLTLAVAATTLQFIFTNTYKDLNATLKVFGLAVYAYSIYTNMLGAVNILKTTENMGWIIAVFIDVAAEPLISWGMGEALVGDLIGNGKKILWGEPQKRQPSQRAETEYKPYREPAQSRFKIQRGNFDPAKTGKQERKEEPTYRWVGRK
jgi:hypothetical protein